MSQSVNILACSTNELALNGLDLHVEIAHAAESVRKNEITVEVFIGRVGRIGQGESKGVGVVVVIEGFGVELAASEEQAVFLRAAHVGGYHVYDAVIEEHVGVDLLADL